MLELPPGVRQLTGFPRNKINAYLIGKILIDAGTILAGRRTLKQVRDLGLQANLWRPGGWAAGSAAVPSPHGARPPRQPGGDGRG